MDGFVCIYLFIYLFICLLVCLKESNNKKIIQLTDTK